jgi:hypothetical protein
MRSEISLDLRNISQDLDLESIPLQIRSNNSNSNSDERILTGFKTKFMKKASNLISSV